MEPKHKFTNSPVDTFSSFAKDIQSRSKEEQEEIRTKLRTERYSSAKFTGLAQEYNIKNQMYMEQGSNPTDVLWWSASALAMKAKETNDPRYLDLIPKIETKHGNYAQTMKGRKLIYDTYREIQSNLNAENLSDSKRQEAELKEEKRLFRIDANEAYYNFKTNPSDDTKTAWENFQKRSREEGYDNILKDVVIGLDAIGKGGIAKPIKDGEILDLSADLLADDTLTNIELSSNPESISNEILAHMVTELEFDVKPNQRLLVANHIKTIVSSNNIDFFKDSGADGENLIKGFYEEISGEDDGISDLYKTAEVLQAEQIAITSYKKVRQELWMKYLKLAKNENPDKEYVAFPEWSPTTKGEFRKEVDALNKGIISTYRQPIKEVYLKNKATDVPLTKEKTIYRALNERYMLNKHIEEGTLPTDDIVTKYLGGNRYEDKKAMEERVKVIEGYMAVRHPEIWNGILKALKTADEVSQEISLISPDTKDTKYVTTIEKLIEDSSPESEKSFYLDVANYLKGEGKTLDKESDDYLKVVGSTLTTYRKVPQLGDALKELRTKLISVFPNWMLGDLDTKSWGLYTVRKDSASSLTEVERAQAKQREVHQIIKEELIKHSNKFKKGYEAFKVKEKDTFEAALKVRLDEALSKDKMEKLTDAAQEGEGDEETDETKVTSIEQATTILRGASTSGIVDNSMLNTNNIDGIDEGLKLIGKMGDTSTNDLYEKLGLTGATTSEEKRNAIATKYYTLMGQE